jgi:hypothetical protein
VNHNLFLPIAPSHKNGQGSWDQLQLIKTIIFSRRLGFSGVFITPHLRRAGAANAHYPCGFRRTPSWEYVLLSKWGVQVFQMHINVKRHKTVTSFKCISRSLHTAGTYFKCTLLYIVHFSNAHYWQVLFSNAHNQWLCQKMTIFFFQSNAHYWTMSKFFSNAHNYKAINKTLYTHACWCVYVCFVGCVIVNCMTTRECQTSWQISPSGKDESQ